MAKIDPTKRELDKLRELDLGDPSAVKALTLALGHKSPAVVKRAAQMASQGGLFQLVTELVQAYHRQKTDPGCETKTAIVKSLVELEAPVEDFYLAQRLYRQKEWVYGEQIETAGELRGLCLLGLARCNHRDLLRVLVDLMLDDDLNTRLMAVRAAGDSGQPGAIPLLRLKALTETEPDVIAETLLSLLHLDAEPTIAWIRERFLEAQETWEAVILALGQSRHPGSLQLLIEQYRPSLLRRDKASLLLAIASCRGVDFLLGLLSDEPELALKALELYRYDPSVWERVEASLPPSTLSVTSRPGKGRT